MTPCAAAIVLALDASASVAHHWRDVAISLRRKLIREIAGL